MAWLLIETPDGHRRQYKLGELDSGFGRAKANAVPLADQKCSSFHCLFKPLRHGRYGIADAGSRNGTRVNGVPLGEAEERPLEDGDVVTIGQTNIRFMLAEPDDDVERILNPQETAAAMAAAEAERVGEPPSSTQLALDTAAIQHAIDTAVAGHNRTATQPQSLPLGRGLGRGLGRDGATAESAAVALPASQAEPLSADVDTTEAVAPLADGRRLETRPPAFAVLAMSVALTLVAAFVAGTWVGGPVSQPQPQPPAGGAGDDLRQRVHLLQREQRATQQLLREVRDARVADASQHAVALDELHNRVATLIEALDRPSGEPEAIATLQAEVAALRLLLTQVYGDRADEGLAPLPDVAGADVDVDADADVDDADAAAEAVRAGATTSANAEPCEADPNATLD